MSSSKKVMTPDEKLIRDNLKAEIAERIRRELVCCDIYDKVEKKAEELQDTKKYPHNQLWDAEEFIPGYNNHQICHWGEYAARIAEGIDTYDG